MVKNIYRIISILIILSAISFSSCNNDMAGFVASNDLDERLISKNDFPFLNGIKKDGTERNWEKSPPLIGSEYKFIIVTDTHIEDGDDFGLEKIKNVIADYNAANTTKIAFAVNNGDITQHGTEHDIDKFIEIADSLGVPFYPTIGNHDIYFGNWPVWRDKIGSTNYRIDIKDSSNNLHTSLLFMDSANAFLGRRQLDWLEFELRKPLPANIFVFTHSTLFTSGIKMQQLTDSREIARLASILKDKVNIMFSGHSHQRVENKTGNVRFVTFEDFKTTGYYIVVDVKTSGVSYSFEKL